MPHELQAACWWSLLQFLTAAHGKPCSNHVPMPLTSLVGDGAPRTALRYFQRCHYANAPLSTVNEIACRTRITQATKTKSPALHRCVSSQQHIRDMWGRAANIDRGMQFASRWSIIHARALEYHPSMFLEWVGRLWTATRSLLSPTNS